VAPPTGTGSHPGRAIAALVALIIIMLAGIIGKDAVHPGRWHKDFKVGLGLDLSSGTTVTLKAVTPNARIAPNQTEMNEAKSIMEARVNGAGFTGALVQQQGPSIITVAVPGKGAQQVENLVGRTALLRFRQVLLVAPNLTTSTGTQSATPSPSSPAAKPKKSSKAKSAASPSPAASASPAATPSPSSSAVLSTVANGQGDQAAVTPAVKALFSKLNCSDRNWQELIYGTNHQNWDNLSTQIVACYQGQKYVLDKSTVTGEDLSSASASLATTGSWQVNLNFNSTGAKNFATLTESMYAKYAGSASTPQNNFAIVLDGVPVSIAYIQQPIANGQGQITGSFTQNQADYLANVLTYGHLPLSFQNQSTESISAQLGSAQLQAGLLAGAVGLLLVVIYSFLYYRGLGVVSVSSLGIAAVLAFLSVVLLTRYEGFTLNLAGVAGLIVAIGITADSFVVFFERLRDEVREGRTLRPAVERGWGRARRTILVSDTVSFLAAAVLYYFSIGDVKGFAFTLGMTTVIDVVVVFLFTKPMMTILARTRFYGQGHRLSGLDPARLGARSPWRGSRRPALRPVTGEATAAPARPSRTTPKEA
jgi:preprotein translocase subunit SecD